MWEYRSPEELYHYGILGMRWGHRKASYRTSSNSKNNRQKRRHASQDAITAKKISKKKLYEMSNDDLRTLNKRKQLESDYKRLNKQKIKKGAAIVGSIAGFTASVITIKNNGGQLIKSGKDALKKVKAIKVKP